MRTATPVALETARGLGDAPVVLHHGIARVTALRGGRGPGRGAAGPRRGARGPPGAGEGGGPETRASRRLRAK